MPKQDFILQFVTLEIDDSVELVKCHGFPEISSLGDKAGRGAVDLRVKVRALLGDEQATPVTALHRRLTGNGARVEQMKLTLSPLKKRADWQMPAELRFGYITWSEAEDLHLAFIPVLGVQVIASKPEQIAPRLEEHVRLSLVHRVERVLLSALSATQCVRALRVDAVSVRANLKPPRALYEERNSGAKAEPVLPKVATKLTGLNAGPAYELDLIVDQICEALFNTRRPRSVLLVGPPGAGKTAAVHELVRRTGRMIWMTTGAQLIAGQSGFGQWQERCRELCHEAAKTRATIHLGNLAELIETGQHSANAQSIASFLRPSIERGELLAIAECTPEQLAAIERRDQRLADAFLQVRVSEPGTETTKRILDHLFVQLARKHTDLEKSACAVNWIDRLHRRYATYSANPGRPIRFLKALIAEQSADQPTVLTIDDVTNAFTRETGLPALLLNDELPLDLDAARRWFAQRVIGQPEAIEAILSLLAAVKMRLGRPNQPLGSFLFMGPTGTGKTELAKSLAEFLFGSAARLVRFDLNEFSDPVSVQRLIGGFGSAEGLLTARVREQPFSVLLLDEFEKADSTFFDLLLQILGDGRLTDGAGRVADFCNTVIIMTSNLGARDFQRGPSGFHVGIRANDDHFGDAIRRFLRPEIYNRLGAIVAFQPLNRDHMLQVLRRQLSLLYARDGLRLRDVEVQLGSGVEEYLAMKGHDPKYGARPLKRVLERELVVPLAAALNEVRHSQPLTASVTLTSGVLTFDVLQRQSRGTAAVMSCIYPAPESALGP